MPISIPGRSRSETAGGAKNAVGTKGSYTMHSELFISYPRRQPRIASVAFLSALLIAAVIPGCSRTAREAEDIQKQATRKLEEAAGRKPGVQVSVQPHPGEPQAAKSQEVLQPGTRGDLSRPSAYAVIDASEWSRQPTYWTFCLGVHRNDKKADVLLFLRWADHRSLGTEWTGAEIVDTYFPPAGHAWLKADPSEFKLLGDTNNIGAVCSPVPQGSVCQVWGIPLARKNLLSITGMLGGKANQGVAEVEVTWQWVPTRFYDAMLKESQRLATLDSAIPGFYQLDLSVQQGRVKLILYDDGWRWAGFLM